MTSSIVQFQFGFSDVRVVLVDSEPWLIAGDVCDVLGLGNVSKACERLDEDEKGITSSDTLGGNQDVLIISESGFYRLVMTSRKPEVRKFQKWVTSVVIPSIRKTGSYSIAPEIPVSKQLLIEQSKTVAQNVVDIQQLLGGSQPRLAQLLIDIGINDFVESNQPKLAGNAEFPEDCWYSLVSIAEKMGIKTNSSTRTSLGLSVGKKGLERVQEERLCNGEMRPIWCYRDNPQTRQAIDEWADSLAEI